MDESPETQAVPDALEPEEPMGSLGSSEASEGEPATEAESELEAAAEAEPVAESESEVEAAPEPEGAEPAAESESEVAEPEVAEPEVAEPEVAEPAAEAEPVVEAGPEVAEPEVAEPAVAEAEPVRVAKRARKPVAAAPEELPAEDEELVETSRDPYRGPGDWYVVHTYAGYENKVKTNLESRIHTMQMEDKIFDVHIPMEDVMEIKGGKKQVVQKKIFPGYLLVKMIYDNDSWYVVRNTPGVTGFVAAGTGSKPTPLSRREVEKILAVKKEEVKPQFRLGFEENDVVRIISGPFADFNGTISEINLDQSKLKVLVNIFDRETPVELSFDQVAKV